MLEYILFKQFWSIYEYDTFQVAKTILEYLMYQVQRRINRDSDQELEETSALKLFGEPILPESVETLESFAVGEHTSAESMQKCFVVDHEVVIYWLTLDICLVRNF